ncbi:G-D-S-L family lipolytic protein [Flavobacterium sp.]|uniref:G-D-S-L family lipolytic protein n=1 Tax=Flavobacterium sp. TaxID=239 RepID=UPI00286AB487|nr:G-D-S-L family lipolytic protein [Flavobacterium sp.]
MIKNFKMLFLVSVTFIACNNNDEETIVENSSDGLPLTAGEANFTKFVAVGDSYTAGYSDSALFIEGQKGSFVNIMAQQFALVGGGEFKIPFMADNIGGFKINGTQFMGPRLYFNGVGPVPVPGTPTTEILNPAVAAAGPYNNAGVPGAKSFHLLSPSYGSFAGLALGTASPYYARFATNATTSVLGYAMAQTPTFFSLWIGGNDVLGYALSGGDGTDPITPSAGVAGVGFDATYDALVNTLTSAGAKGVTGNIPYVYTIPHFTTVPTNPVPLVAAQIAQLNPLFGAMNSMLAAAGQPARFQTLTASSTNPLLISDEMQTYDATTLYTTAFQGAPFNYPAATAGFLGALYGKARHASNATATRDYIVLSQAGSIGTNKAGYPPTNSTIGVTFPMEDNATLTFREIVLLKTATDAYNVKIKAKAMDKGLAFVDINALMIQLANGGISANGYNVTDKFVTGGGFSLDGVHVSPRGYALFANKFIEAINTTYKSNLKGVSLYDYRILFPRAL